MRAALLGSMYGAVTRVARWPVVAAIAACCGSRASRRPAWPTHCRMRRARLETRAIEQTPSLLRVLLDVNVLHRSVHYRRRAVACGRGWRHRVRVRRRRGGSDRLGLDGGVLRELAHRREWRAAWLLVVEQSVQAGDAPQPWYILGGLTELAKGFAQRGAHLDHPFWTEKEQRKHQQNEDLWQMPDK